jgi:hypothetical protein
MVLVGVEKAKNLYWRMYSIGSMLGPYLMLDESEHSELNNLLPDIEGVLSDINIERDGRLFRAPSPWHAAICLSVLVHISTSVKGDYMKVNDHLGIPTKKTRIIFRGQSDSKWDLVAKINRNSIDKDKETQAVKVFCAILKSFYDLTDLNIKVPEIAFIAAAQHYGLATNLLDFTADPSVAVYFAATGQKTYDEREAVVFALPLDYAIQRGVEIIFPPPFIERLYVQKGLFVSHQDNLRESCLEFRFPLSREFTVIREGKGVCLLLKDPWLEGVTSFSKNCAESGKTLPTEERGATEFYYEVYKQLGIPRYLRRSYAPKELAKWIDYVSDMLYWLVFVKVNNQMGVDEEVMDFIVRANPGLTEVLIQIYELLADINEGEGLINLAQGRRKLAKLFQASLSRTRST